MKKRSVRAIALMLVLVMLATVLSACGKTQTKDDGAADTADNAGTQADTAANTEVNIVLSGDTGSLHPHAANGDWNAVMRMIYDSPVDPKLDGSLEMLLVEQIDTISDTEYTLHLRQGVTFANGNPFTADDFMFSAELARDDAQFFLHVKSVDFEKTNIVDDYTVDLWLTAYDPGCFTGMNCLYMFDKESYDADALAKEPNGTGPYVVTDYVSNSHVTLQARDDYWGGELGIKTINVTIMNESSQMVNSLVTGDAQFSRIPVKDIEYIESLGDYNVYTASNSSAYCAYINMTPDDSNPFSTLEAREAFMYAIDRQAIVDMVFEGKSRVPSWPLSEDVLDYEPRFSNMSEVYAEGYNPEKAKELADKSGLTGKTIRLITNGGADYVTMAEIIKNNLKDIGVNVEIQNYDAATYFSMLMDESTFDAALFVIAGSTCLAIDLAYSYPGFIPLGWTGEDHDAYMALGAQGMAMSDATARGDIIYQMMEIFNRSYPWFTLAESVSPTAYAKSLGGVEFYLDGTFRVNHWYYEQ